ncbi:MAG: glycoside hydrolase family 3 C-terminal domain-containing protein [Clostridia bacterium]|nr:glycoside hydrolase family 3 C-terminal domain-containing protein [Clostridia bacterium]
MDFPTLLSGLTVEEKAALVAGTDFMYTNPVPRLGIPSLRMSDGPHGLRVQREGGDNGVSESEVATAFPTAALTASGWNPENTRRMGEAIAEECRYYGVHVLLGPGVNIKRNPLCGRNFEYFSEDPLLASELASAEVEGLQSKGVGACVKHFALNNSENFRFMGNSAASEKTMRELYLKVFERIVKKAKPSALMCAYNRINGVFCSENKWLLTDVLRTDWGFDGLVMTDWGAIKDRLSALRAGLDLEMPGDTAVCRKQILDGIKDGSLSMTDLDNAVANVLKWVDAYVRPADPSPVDFDRHHELAAEIATDCAVLMKNDGMLPLSKTDKLHICGDMFSHMRYQGSGSSMINPARLTTPEEAFEKRGIRSFPVGECDKILVFAGLTDDYESEGCDRADMKLPSSHLQLISDMVKTGKPVAVVLFGGSPVELPFNEEINALLNMYLPGQNGGEAVARLLFGDVNPSGKLAETWPLTYEDVPSHETFGKGINEVYAEGKAAGYRYYRSHGVPVRYPFGHGLSYTTFEQGPWVQEGETWTTTVTNTGSRSGAEVVQLWQNGELAGFQKVYVEPGETKTVTLTPGPEARRDWSDDLTVPDEPVSFPVTVESPFKDLRQTFMGRVFYNSVLSVVRQQQKKAAKMPDGPEKDNAVKGALFMERAIVTNSLRSMSMSAGALFPYNLAEGFAEMTNRHFFRGLKKFLTPIKVPKLPKEEQVK